MVSLPDKLENASDKNIQSSNTYLVGLLCSRINLRKVGKTKSYFLCTSAGCSIQYMSYPLAFINSIDHYKHPYTCKFAFNYLHCLKRCTPLKKNFPTKQTNLCKQRNTHTYIYIYPYYSDIVM